MFEWLEQEMSEVNTRKFYLVDGPAPDELRQAIESAQIPLPRSYRQFVLKFGNAKLYRYSKNYYLTIFAGPREAEGIDGEQLVCIGRTWTSHVFFKESLLALEEEPPVFEWRHNQGLRQTGSGFEPWLKARCAAARKRYKKKKWQAIKDGPAPFTELEREVAEARKDFSWRVVGVAANGDLRFKIHNGSTMVLPYLSVGIRGKLRPPNTGPLHGGGYLPTASIRPGETGIVEYDCYKKFVAPEDAEVFELPDPGPEDREQYWEFKPVG